MFNHEEEEIFKDLFAPCSQVTLSHDPDDQNNESSPPWYLQLSDMLRRLTIDSGLTMKFQIRLCPWISLDIAAQIWYS
jgi:hypothetical protein